MTTVFQNTASKFFPRIVQLERAAAQECVEYYGAMVWALAKRSTNSLEAAEKAVQEIFMDVWENAAFCDLTISDEKVWIVLIASRRLAKYSVKPVFPTTFAIAASIN